eukprot:TRINITY_DN5008_c1_g1_i4.p1 TRINITY_DN5008_c1_g1~~TRINITY_DN5008_c1_g1_i4.p1  ORF type:complete len:325 (+),score=21.40 TRINITY_DN5008_c1_g1_i4:101-1075(+)
MNCQPFNFAYVLLLQILLVTLTTCRPLPVGEEFDVATCVWDEESEYCIMNPEAIFLVLQYSDNEFAHMLRCPQITQQQTCDNLQPNTCYWDHGSCKLRSNYFLRHVLNCAETQDREEFEELMDLLNDQYNDTFIDDIQYLLDEITPLSFNPPSDNHFCHLIQSSVECYAGIVEDDERCATDVTYMSSSLFQIQNLIGQFALSPIGRQWPRSIISVHEVSQELGFGDKDTLEKFDRCINLNKQECESNLTLLSDSNFPWMLKLSSEPNSRYAETQSFEKDDDGDDNNNIRAATIIPVTVVLVLFLGILLFITWRRYNIVRNSEKA